MDYTYFPQLTIDRAKDNNDGEHDQPDPGVEDVAVRPEIDGRSHRSLHNQCARLLVDGDAEVDITGALVCDGKDRGEHVQVVAGQHADGARQGAIIEDVPELAVLGEGGDRIEVQRLFQNLKGFRKDAGGRDNAQPVLREPDVGQAWKVQIARRDCDAREIAPSLPQIPVSHLEPTLDVPGAEGKSSPGSVLYRVNLIYDDNLKEGRRKNSRKNI